MPRLFILLLKAFIISPCSIWPLHSLLSGGAWSSFASMCFKYATMRPQPSLGASGSVIVLAATVAFANPDAQFSLIFLPMFHFKAINMVRFDYYFKLC